MKASEAKEISLAEVARQVSFECLLSSIREAASRGLVSIEIHKYQAEKFAVQLQELGYTVAAKKQCGPPRPGQFRTTGGCRVVYLLSWQNPTI